MLPLSFERVHKTEHCLRKSREPSILRVFSTNTSETKFLTNTNTDLLKAIKTVQKLHWTSIQGICFDSSLAHECKISILKNTFSHCLNKYKTMNKQQWKGFSAYSNFLFSCSFALWFLLPYYLLLAQVHSCREGFFFSCFVSRSAWIRRGTSLCLQSWGESCLASLR